MFYFGITGTHIQLVGTAFTTTVGDGDVASAAAATTHNKLFGARGPVI